MAKRKLVLDGPKALVESVQLLTELIANSNKSQQPTWLNYSLEQIKNEANKLRLTAGNSNISEDEASADFLIKDLMQIGSEITTLTTTLQALLKQAQYGPRTLHEDVGNRQELLSLLDQRKNKPTTAIEVALEGLERINQTHGRGAGDQVLKDLASEVSNLAGQGTQVFQEGSNLVLVGEWESEDAAATFADKIANKAKVTRHGRMLKVTIGIAFEETGDILEKASLARETTDDKGIFKPEMIEAKEAKRKTHSAAIKILESKQFRPEYQKIVGANDKKGLFSRGTQKFEALWRSQDLSPFHFFREIKEENRIHEVTESLLPMIFKDIAKKPKVEVSFNVTAEEMSEQFRGKAFADYMIEGLKHFKVPPQNIIIELVEWGDDDRLSDDSMSNLARIVKAGCRLALDDYGVRASNLVRLMHLCECDVIPDFFKIDAALVKSYNAYLESGDTTKGNDHYSILGIRSIVNLVHELKRSFDKDIGIVAEFVTNERLRLALEKEGVTHFQGFYLARPMPAAQAF